MARTQRVPVARVGPRRRAAQWATGLAGARYLLAVALLVALSSGPMLLLVAAGAAALGHHPALLDAGAPPAEAGIDPFLTYPPEPAPPPPPPVATAEPACWPVGLARVPG